MKKIVSKLLLGALTFSLVACSGGGSSTKTGKAGTSLEGLPEVNATTSYGEDPHTLDYVVTGHDTDTNVTTNLVDTLFENDRLGNIVPALAESHEASEDGLTHTFKIRKGVKWVTSTGEEYAELKAQDFVTGLQHATDFKSDTLWLVQSLIVNLDKYTKGEVSFDKVGVKATDDYTLVYTLTEPAPYFKSMTLYTILQPINKEFLEGKGSGCKLGAPNKNECGFGAVQPDSILYNGIFVLTALDSKSKIAYKKNPTYWDKDNVHFNTFTLVYSDGKDPYSQIKGFESGAYFSSALVPSWSDFDKYKTKYKDNYIVTPPNSTTYGTQLNFNRVATNWTNKNAKQLAQAEAAKHNKHFRLALQHAIDRVAYISQSTALDVAKDMVVNLNTFDEIVFNSKGESYERLVSAAYSKLVGKDVSLAYGTDPFLSSEAALAEIELAKKDGIVFPVILDMPVISNDSEVYLNRARSFKASVEKNTNGQIIIDLINKTKDEITQNLFREPDAAKRDYDINTFSGWGPDYSDPKTFADIYSANNGAMLQNMGLVGLGQDAKNDEILNKLGFVKYTEMIQAADKELKDLDKRYQLYAEAEAFLLAEALYLPFQMKARGYLVTRAVPFSGPRGAVGTAVQKYKYSSLQEDIVTKTQYAEAFQKWTNEKQAQQ